MAITFQEQRKRQQYLGIALLGVVALTAIVVWRGFFAAPSSETPGVVTSQPFFLSIDFSLFDTQEFQDIGAAREPIQPPQEVGRQNPFIPFSK